MTENTFYWYRAATPPKEYEVSYYKKNSHYGFFEEPDYEVIEKYDLRFVVKGTFSEVCDQYF